MKDILAFLKKNRILCIVEAAIFGALLLWTIFAPAYDTKWANDTLRFYYPQEELVTLNADGTYTITSDNWNTEMNVWSSDNVTLLPGLYEVVVEYAAEGIIEKDNYIRLSTPTAVNQYKYPQLSDQRQKIAYQFEVPGIAEEFSVDVHYGGYGIMSVKSIHLYERTIGRLGYMLQCILLISAVNVIVYLYEKSKARGALVAMIAAVLFVSLPFMTDYLLSGHDLSFHTGRIQLIADALRSGQFPVRIYDTAFEGYGYACPTMYGEIMLYFPAILYILGVPLYRAYQIYMCLVSAGTMAIAYYAFGRMTKSSKAGAFGAILYTCSMWRMVNMTLRAAVGEYTAMMFLPLIVYAIWGLLSRKIEAVHKKRLWVPLCIGMTGLLHSHLISMFLAGFFSFIAVMIYCKRFFCKENLLIVGKALLAFLLLNVWFIIPFFSMAGMDFYLYHPTDSFARDLLYPAQMFLGFASLYGKNVQDGMYEEMPLSMGIPLTIVVISVFVIMAQLRQEKEKNCYKVAKVTSLFALLALWITSIYFPWSMLRKIVPFFYDLFVKIQFPWRLLVIATVLLSVAGAAAFQTIYEAKERMAYLYGGVILAIAVVLIGTHLANYTNDFQKEVVCSIDEKDLYMDELYLVYGTNYKEMMREPVASDGIAIANEVKENGVYRIMVENGTAAEGILVIPMGYYPFYEATDMTTGNGFVLEMEPNTKTLLVHIPAGYTGTVQCSFVSPFIWRVGEIITVLSVIGYIVFVVIQRRKKSEKQIREEA